MRGVSRVDRGLTCTDVEASVEPVNVRGQIGAPDFAGGERRRGRPREESGDQGGGEEVRHGDGAMSWERVLGYAHGSVGAMNGCR